MLTTLLRLWRHWWTDERSVRRVVPADALQRLGARVAASEQRHTGQVRLCIEGSLPMSYLWRHLRHGVPMAQLRRQRALMMFSKLAVWDTERNNGVLIYLLLAEHAIELVADRGLAPQVNQAQWDAMVQRLGTALRAGRFEEGLTQALEEISAVLVEHFAREPGALPAPDNELPDDPVLL